MRSRSSNRLSSGACKGHCQIAAMNRHTFDLYLKIKHERPARLRLEGTNATAAAARRYRCDREGLVCDAREEKGFRSCPLLSKSVLFRFRQRPHESRRDFEISIAAVSSTRPAASGQLSARAAARRAPAGGRPAHLAALVALGVMIVYDIS
ncbi:hypothetical protein EVAR_59785_1 [Eumeta japonica]|uniref:Uncharacterized protein n=1 Tax=Eumeta variegata TaxID=151549 RepID=A0A4C1YB79_EUMVA|nr:hypothetical protein EVAR_59785_1 [Eumeta japonica]